MADIVWPNIGNALLAGTQARYYAQRADREDDAERRRQEAQPHIAPALAGDEAAMAKVIAADPQGASAIAQALSRLDARKLAQVKDATDYTMATATGILNAPAGERAKLYDGARADAQTRGMDISKWPTAYDESWVRFNFNRAIPAKVWFEEQQKNARKGQGGGGVAPGLEPIGGGGAPMPGAPAPAPAPAGRPVAMAPAAAPPTMVAQAPTAPPGIEQGGDPQPAPGMGDGTPRPPQAQTRRGPIWDVDPTDQGYVLAQDPKKPGRPVVEDGHFVFIHPQTKAVAVYKPRATKTEGGGPFAGTSLDAQAMNILLRGDPGDPQYAAAYAHLAAPKVQLDPTTGQAVMVRPDLAWARPPMSAGGLQTTAPQQTGPGVSVTPVPGLQKTPESFKKLDTEVRAVMSAIDNFQKIITEAGGGSFRALINDPTSPQAQKVLGAYNAMKTALRSEAFVNTGVLQPAEMTMLDSMLLAPNSVRGYLATPEGYAASLDQIRNFVGNKIEAARGAYGLPGGEAKPAAPAAKPDPKADLKKKYGLE